MASNNPEKESDFEELVRKHPKITDQELKDFRDTRIDLMSQLYLWLLGAGIIAAGLIAAVHLGSGSSFSIVDEVYLILGLGLVIVIFVTQWATLSFLGHISLFTRQKEIFDEYLNAREKLTKSSNLQTGRPNGSKHSDTPSEKQ